MALENKISITIPVEVKQQVISKLNDTKTLCGSEGYGQSLLYYNSVNQAAKKGVENSGVIYDDLKKRFPSNPHKEVIPQQV